MSLESNKVEDHRALWAKVAKDNGWYKEPFYVQIWVNKRGKIEDSVSHKGLKNQDLFVDWASDTPITKEEAVRRGVIV